MAEDSGLSATEWVHRGGMIYRREYLAPTDSESWFSLWYKKFGDLNNFPWSEFGLQNGPPKDFPWKHFGLDPFKICPNCGHKHEEGLEKQFLDESNYK